MTSAQRSLVNTITPPATMAILSHSRFGLRGMRVLLSPTWLANLTVTMKSETINIHDAKTQLSRLIARAEKGERITIARGGKAVAQLGPLTRAKPARGTAVDPLLLVDEYSFPGPVVALTNREIDAIVYDA